MRRLILAFSILMPVGEALAQTKDTVKAPLEVEWMSGRRVVITKKEAVIFNGEKARVEYDFSFGSLTPQMPPVVELRIHYSKEGRNPKTVSIVDVGADGTADKVLVDGRRLVSSIYTRGESKTDKIFLMADELLSRFREELQASRAIEVGPDNVANPFVQTE